jgi:para-nitrobenzyl esterase
LRPSTSVALLMLCEQSRDLFQKAILGSVPGRERVRTMEMAEDDASLGPRAMTAA